MVNYYRFTFLSVVKRQLDCCLSGNQGISAEEQTIALESRTTMAGGEIRYPCLGQLMPQTSPMLLQLNWRRFQAIFFHRDLRKGDRFNIV